MSTFKCSSFEYIDAEKFIPTFLQFDKDLIGKFYIKSPTLCNWSLGEFLDCFVLNVCIIKTRKTWKFEALTLSCSKIIPFLWFGPVGMLWTKICYFEYNLCIIIFQVLDSHNPKNWYQRLFKHGIQICY